MFMRHFGGMGHARMKVLRMLLLRLLRARLSTPIAWSVLVRGWRRWALISHRIEALGAHRIVGRSIKHRRLIVRMKSRMLLEVLGWRLIWKEPIVTRRRKRLIVRMQRSRPLMRVHVTIEVRWWTKFMIWRGRKIGVVRRKWWERPCRRMLGLVG